MKENTRKIYFGRIQISKSETQDYTVFVDLTLTENNVFSAQGRVYRAGDKDCCVCGQCLDAIWNYKDQLNNTGLFLRIYRLWRKWHLNDMHSGTPKQEECLEYAFPKNYTYDYKKACEVLKQNNLYEDNGYRFGSAWLKVEISPEDLKEINSILDEETTNN